MFRKLRVAVLISGCALAAIRGAEPPPAKSGPNEARMDGLNDLNEHRRMLESELLYAKTKRDSVQRQIALATAAGDLEDGKAAQLDQALQDWQDRYDAVRVQLLGLLARIDAAALRNAPRKDSAASPEYTVLPGTTSPNGRYALAFGSREVPRFAGTPPAAGPVPGSILLHDTHDFLFDTRRKRVVGRLPDFDDADGHGVRGPGELEVAWTPDSRHALAIRRVGRKDAAIAWIEPAAGKFPDVQEQMEDAFGRFLAGPEQPPRGRYLHFQDPVALGPAVIVVDAWEQWPMRAPTHEYRLKMRFTPAAKGGAVRCTVLAGHRREDASEPEWLGDTAVMEKYCRTLRASLSPKAQAALDEEQAQWIAWCHTQPKDAQTTLVSQRSALLRAREEFP